MIIPCAILAIVVEYEGQKEQAMTVWWLSPHMLSLVFLKLGVQKSMFGQYISTTGHSMDSIVPVCVLCCMFHAFH